MTKPMFRLMLVMSIVFPSLFSFGQGTECAGATNLPVNATCVTQGFTNNENGTSPEYTSTCATAGTGYEDVWFTVTGTGNPMTVTISNTNQDYTLTAMTSCTGGQLDCTQQTAGTNGSVTFATTLATTYYIHIQRRSGNNNNNMSGDICAVSTLPAGACSTDLIVGSTTYSNTGLTTCGAGDDFSSTDACGSSYMNGDDYVIEYTPTTSECVNFTLSNTGTWVGIFLTDACPDAVGANCLTNATSTAGNPSMSYTVTAGTTYFITISTFPAPQCTAFDIDIAACPPPPANDECTGAIPLTVNPDELCGTVTSGTVVNATTSPQANGCGGTADDDVWYSFVATSTTHTVSLLNTAGSTTDMYHSVYSGTCGALSAELVCSDPDASTVGGLTVGNTYFVRVYTWTGTTGQTSTFDICIGTPVPTSCVADLTVSSTLYSNTGLTTCGAGDDYSSTDACGSSYMNGDDYLIEYTPTTSECVQFTLSNTGTWVGIFLTDACPDSPTASCLTSGTNSAGNPSMTYSVTAGTTYYITVSTFPAPQCTAFDIDISACPPAPPNDDCTGAIPLTVNPDNLCGTTTAGTIQNATLSAQANGCGGTADDDVWYSFVATNTTHLVSLLNVAGSTTDMYHSVYAGTCGTIGAALVCSDPNASTVTGLTIGNTYYVRVYSWTGTAGQTSTFDICIGTPPPPPSNDDCSGAINVPVSTGACSTVTSSVASATTSSDPNGCFGTADDDVWFSFTATSTDVQIDLSNISGSTTDLYHSVYAGTCGALGAELVCSDPNTSQVNSLTIGNVYFVRVYSYTATAGQTTVFDICISEIGPCGSTSATEDFCPTAATLTQGPGSWSSSTYPYYTADLPGNVNSVFCGSIENNSWYQFTALSSTETFNITSVTNCVNNFGIQAEVYEVTYDANGCCTNFTSMSNCFNPGTNTTGTVTATGLTVGSSYMIMFDGNAGDNCDFTISNWTATGIILPVELIDLNAIGMPQKNIVSWKTVSEQNSSHFEIRRSFDGINYEKIGGIQAAGESTELLTYSFDDEDVRTGVVYYLLVQYDLDGLANATEVVTLKRSTARRGILSARPNPTESNLIVEINPNSTHITPTVQLMDGRGLIVHEKALSPGELNTVNMNLSGLASGVYFLMYTDNNGVTYSEKILKK